ncbi:DUF5701 family protein [Demequina activiva]|uniref:Uncharacterized protein n=1 Tax=Demequina activiva TaxID=1582364 RepID=A0A919Q3B9_9MICO|nr:DUF5701 family protein [Demequina activiva]GIG55279.1 hypothetical protein Dac01nite_20310 [Demequina activiva]
MPSILLDHQVDAFIAAGLPGLAGIDEAAFRQLFEPVRASASALSQETDARGGRLPYIAVVTDALVDPAPRVPGMRLTDSEREGILDRNHGDEGLAPYRARPELTVPEAPVYLLVDVERGDEYRDVAPREALPRIGARERTPLTIAEGLSIMAAHPGFLHKNHCFMLGGSTRGDKRVPAIWISERAPKLGWCFQGVPHSWLGVASAASRTAV